MRALLSVGLAVLASVGTAGPESYSFDLHVRNLMVRGDRTADASITFDVTNDGQQPHGFVVRAVLMGVPDWTSPPLEGHDLAPGATRSFALAAKDLRAGWNQLNLTLLQDGHHVGNAYQEYRKDVPGGLPDLKVVHVRRLGVGLYAFAIKNVGKAETGPYTVDYGLDGFKWLPLSPDPAPSLAPGRSLAFTLRDLPEHVANPKKDRFNLHLAVDRLNRIPEWDEGNNAKTTGYGYNGSWAENHP